MAKSKPANEKKSVKALVFDGLVFVGIPAIALAVIILYVKLSALDPRIDNTSQRIDDLIAKIGGAEERFRQAEAKATEYKDIIDRMQKLDQSKIAAAMAVMENPNFNELDVSQKLLKQRSQIDLLSQEVGWIYKAANESAFYPNLLTYYLNSTFVACPALYGQSESGQLPAEWLSQHDWQQIYSRAPSLYVLIRDSKPPLNVGQVEAIASKDQGVKELDDMKKVQLNYLKSQPFGKWDVPAETTQPVTK